MHDHQLDRRRFVQGLVAGATAAAGLSTLSSCAGTGDGGTGGGVRGQDVRLPTYRRTRAVEPDLPGDEHGVPDAFFTYPHPAKPIIETPPGKGGEVTAMFGATLAVPPAMGQNSWWQGLNDQLGVELRANMTPNADYPAKLATGIAGGDLPDLVQLTGVPRLPDVLAAEFEDLTEYLSGDAVLDYPYLASLPTLSWRTTVFNGAIYAVPPQNLVGTPTWISRLDLIDELGANPDPRDAEEFFDLCVELTERGTNRYALADPSAAVMHLAAAMYDAPNTWSADDNGGFIHMYETEEYRAALEYITRLWSAGVFHPDSFGKIKPQDLLKAGKVIFHAQGGVGYRNVLRANIPGLKLGFFAVPKADGSGVAAKRLGAGTYQLCGITKQDSPDRVRELLAILNYLAVPFGSAEHLYRFFGKEGVHHIWDDELQAPIDTEKAVERLQVSYLASAPYELFDIGYTEATQQMHDHQKATVPHGVQSAALGLYSETEDREGQNLGQAIETVRNDVIQGRKTLADWDGAVKTWRSGGGDRIREEYQSAHVELTVQE